ncbi:hypothetical protein [Pseudonocardia xinjiangensis]|uniref:Uncharacterized protein n=1 Tax=Pseudonocardia xinjiangensis TaxID=75289 RepID=A0ABX1RKA6_9PSEU|nr:hypothetical protein [Pseudonocardia xinjiangensis]NMH79825.1 hypothetical protein [Pseudonocardia xinjiangensis]
MPAVPHEVVLLEIPVDADFADFRAEFERAVPRVDHERMEEIIARSPWQATTRAAPCTSWAAT